MTDRRKTEDQWLDHNLRRLGRSMDLPEEPTPRQQAAWKQPRLTLNNAAAAPRRGFIRRHRLLTLATTAAAAVVVLSVFLITPRGSMVEAGVILNDLRQTLLNGFEVTFENIGDDGVYVDGVLMVTLRPAGDSRLSAVGRGVDPSLLEVDSAYARLRLLGDSADDRKAGLDLESVVALSDASQWAYVKMTGLPQGVVEEHPLALALVGMTSCGFLLDLGDMRDVLDAEKTQASSTPPRIHLEYPERNDVSQTIKDFLIGRAGADQIDHILKLIAQTARDVHLDEIKPGLLLLQVREFNVDTLDPYDAAQLRNMTLQVAYRKGVGIESARLDHIGRYDGVMRLAPIHGDLNDELLDKNAVYRPGTTAVLDVSAMKPLLERVLNR